MCHSASGSGAEERAENQPSDVQGDETEDYEIQRVVVMTHGDLPIATPSVFRYEAGAIRFN
jgi:hypothetical protein